MPQLLAALPAIASAGSAAGSSAAAGTAISSGAAAGVTAAAGSAAAAGGGIGTASAIGAEAIGGAAGAVGSLETASGLTTAVTGVAGITSAIGSFAQGRYQQKAASAQSTELEQQAGLEREQAGVQIAQQDYKAIQLMGRIKASAGGSGAGTGGSSGEVYKTSSQEQQLNDLYTKRSGQLASMRDLYKAALARSEGAQYAEAGYIGAGGGLLTSAARVSSIYSGNFASPYISSGLPPPY